MTTTKHPRHTKQLRASCSDAELHRIQSAAAKDGLSMNGYIRRALGLPVYTKPVTTTFGGETATAIRAEAERRGVEPSQFADWLIRETLRSYAAAHKGENDDG